MFNDPWLVHLRHDLLIVSWTRGLARYGVLSTGRVPGSRVNSSSARVYLPSSLGDREKYAPVFCTRLQCLCACPFAHACNETYDRHLRPWLPHVTSINLMVAVISINLIVDRPIFAFASPISLLFSRCSFSRCFSSSRILSCTNPFLLLLLWSKKRATAHDTTHPKRHTPETARNRP